MTLGFVVIRHVCSKQTDLYWKESYRCIRKWYPEAPILIIDDSSNREFLVEDIVLTNCTVIYDTRHKGAAELLPYYYFHLLHPFDTAVILHDSAFLQEHLNFELDDGEPCRKLWTFHHGFDQELSDITYQACIRLPGYHEYARLFHVPEEWSGCFGAMAIVRWDFLDSINQQENLFANWLPFVRSREVRYGIERAFALVLTKYYPDIRTMFGSIYDYCTWGLTFNDYLTNPDVSKRPLVKVWSSR